MPRIKKGSIVRRPDLGMAVREYMNNGPTMGYIGLDVMPIFRTAQQSASYPVLPAEALLSMPETARAMRAAFNRGDWEFENGLYSTKQNGWEEPIDDREAALYANYLDVEMISTERAVDIILRKQEARIAGKVFNPTRFTANAVTNEWDDKANATPIDDIKAGKNAIRQKCGMLPDTLIISYSVFQNVKGCAQIVDQMKYTTALSDITSITPQQLAAIFDIPRVLVAGAVYNSAKKGQDASIADIWDNEYAMLTVTNSSNDIRVPCIGRTFLWTETSPENYQVKTYREDQTQSDVIQVDHDTDEALMASYKDDMTIKSDIAANVSFLMSNITT